MASLTVIGRGVRVRGRIQGDGELTIDGFVEGEVVLTGDVTIDSEGQVAANVSARVVTVRGAVRGDLVAEEAVRLEDGARVVGDLRAPRVAIARGALVRGHVQTSGSASAPRARAQTAAAPRAVAAPTPKVAAPDARPAAAPPRAVPTPAVVASPRPSAAVRPVASTLAGAPNRPPPPVVPVLKKGSKAALKKKAT
jgi:cytoskeletal protein CcmA (bactofilin family)